MKLIFLYGPGAVGKLTVARELSRQTGGRLAVFHNPLVVDELLGQPRRCGLSRQPGAKSCLCGSLAGPRELLRELHRRGANLYLPLPDSGLTIDTSQSQPEESARLIREFFHLAG